MSTGITCIICPKSCKLKVEGPTKPGKKPKIVGAECSRGKKYAISEIFDPRRTFTSTVMIKGGELKLVPVRTSKPIRKEEWTRATEIIKSLQITAPVKFGGVLKKDFTEEGIKLIATREISISDKSPGL